LSYKFKPQQSCQFQAPAVMSANFNLFLQYNLFLLTAKWLVRIQEQLVPVNLSLLSAKWLVRIEEQLVPVNLLLLSVKWLVRIQEQLVPVDLLSFLFSVKWLVRIQRTTCTCAFMSVISQATSSNTRTACAPHFVSVISQAASSNPRTACARLFCWYPRSSSQFEPKEQLAPVNLLFVSPVNLVICYLMDVYQSRNGYDIPWYLLSCQCLPIPQWIRHTLLNLILSFVLHS